jgi:electron-transferring-flavoprotein dehydrogenase
VLEKAREAGQHCLSGALLDPRSMKELLPGFESEAPLDAVVHKEAVHFLTRTGHYQLPLTPPPLKDHGNYVISINRFVKWLARQSRRSGHHDLHRLRRIGTAFEKDADTNGDGDRVVGVRTDDKGVDKQNQQKSNFEPGYDVKAKVVVLAEGTRGSLTKQLIQKLDLMKDRNPQTYGVGVKELWEVPPDASRPAKSSTPWVIR